jgi:hypothetical protein
MKKISLFFICINIFQSALAQSITLDPSLTAGGGVSVNSDIAFSNALKVRDFGTFRNLVTGNANVVVFEAGGVLEGIQNAQNGTLLLVYNGIGNNAAGKNLVIKHAATAAVSSFYQILTPDENDYVLKKNNAGVLLVYLTSKGKWKIIDTEIYKKPSYSNEWMTQKNIFQQNPTDFLGTTDNQPLVFRTDNTEQVRITTDGKVGIGTSTPKTKLDINGNISLAAKEIQASLPVVYNSLNRSLLSRIKFNTQNLADITINGINQAIDGTIFFILTGVFTTLIINHNNSNALASERIFTPSGQSLVLPPNSGATLIHAAGHWHIFGTHTNGNRNVKPWITSGNFPNQADSAFIGTKDMESLSFRTDSIERIQISRLGNIRIGPGVADIKPFSVTTSNNFTFNVNLIPAMKATFEDNQSHFVGINTPNNKKSTLLLDYYTYVNIGQSIIFPHNKIEYSATNNLRLGSGTSGGITVSEFNVGIRTNTPKTKLDVDGPVVLEPLFILISPDITLIEELDIENKSFYQCKFFSQVITQTINGIKAPEGGQNAIGTMLFFSNMGSRQLGSTVVLKHNTGLAANRVISNDGQDIVLGPDRNLVLIYDYDGWKVVGR